MCTIKTSYRWQKNAVLDNFKENFCIDPNKTCETLGLGSSVVVFELKMKVIENTDDINCNSALYLLPRSHPIVLRRKYKIIIICLISQSEWNTLIGQVQISELSDW